MATILKVNNTILRTGSNIFLTGQAPVPVLDLDAANLPGANGSPISTWPEPNGNNAFQTVATQQPVIETAGGFKAARFDGVDDHLRLTMPATVRTAFLVLECVNSSGSGFTPLLSSSSGNGTADVYFDGDGSNWFRNFSSQPMFGSNSVDRLFTNGTRITPIHSQPKLAVRHLLCLDVAGWDVALTHIVRRVITGNGSINMRLFRLIVYDRRLTDLDRNAITQQLRTQYAI